MNGVFWELWHDPSANVLGSFRTRKAAEEARAEYGAPDISILRVSGSDVRVESEYPEPNSPDDVPGDAGVPEEPNTDVRNDPVPDERGDTT